MLEQDGGHGGSGIVLDEGRNAHRKGIKGWETARLSDLPPCGGDARQGRGGCPPAP
ncbi:hypothetical protein GR138_02330 [Shinella kummerowiae]|uniref:Uncharacterized protein n=1 Tax=Shinella kummerowiae TaxID=417745 RepID=A0A6N8S6I8_9HYPH|nr:hypothetical protein [Shinella kummerowiae]